MKATEFELPDQNGNVRKLLDYRGKMVLVYFYPKDDTPGCTKEACSFRDSFYELEKLGVQILGISKDSVKSHKKFADKFNLNFPILSDESTNIIKGYGAWGEKKFWGKTYDGIVRKSFLIGKNGEIIKTYEKVNPTIHAQEIIKDVKKIQ